MILPNNEISKYTSKELSSYSEDPNTFCSLRIHNKLLNKLKNHYYCDEMTEHFYDYYEDDEGNLLPCEERLDFCNWVEPYFKGNWDMSQEFVDEWALNQLRICKRWTVDKSHRFFIKNKGNTIEIFAFGRDEYGSDFWWIYKRKGEEPNKGLPVTL